MNNTGRYEVISHYVGKTLEIREKPDHLLLVKTGRGGRSTLKIMRSELSELNSVIAFILDKEASQ